MDAKLKRFTVRYANLLFFLLLVCLTGCEKEEKERTLTEDERIKIEDNEITAEEADIEEKGDLESEGRNDTDSHLDTMEIYERFLNGELTVTWEKEQVPIAELFWDNDIEYCFYDIDGAVWKNCISGTAWYIMQLRRAAACRRFCLKAGGGMSPLFGTDSAGFCTMIRDTGVNGPSL
ncbi:hypothetical protein D7V90_04950 [bacterium 1xD42-87]|nr:hypothetical protein D7V90_04950 [bacterium 1xD42-87]